MKSLVCSTFSMHRVTKNDRTTGAFAIAWLTE